jgi:diguanylate cyclase (GGDEF)-like protein
VLIGLALGIAGFTALLGIQALVSRHRTLTYRATHDLLSGLLNRAGLLEHLTDSIDAGDVEFALLYLDLDRFKSINDSLGHAAGDELLTIVARRITDVAPKDCRAARLGGDEFVVTCPLGDGTNGVRMLAERISSSIVEPIEISGRLLRIGTSVGIACGPWDGCTPIDVLGYANLALHRAKENGRGRIEEFTVAMRDEVDRRSADEARLRQAIEAGDIVPFFQPEYDQATGRLVGAEILARWIDPDGAHVGAATILALVDDPSTLEKITASVVQQARPIIRRLDAMGLASDFRFRVNIPQRCTPRAWRDGQIVAALRGVEPRRLTIDLHESSRENDPVAADEVLNLLRKSGARVCLEDVTGSDTAWGSVPSLPVDEVRIDARRLTSPSAIAMARAVIGLSKDLGLLVSATGVETPEIAESLSSLGCDRQQGFAHSQVLTADGLEDEVMRDALKRASDHLIA